MIKAGQLSVVLTAVVVGFFFSIMAHSADATLPTIFIAGDSTAAGHAGDTVRGWGEPFAALFDPAKVRVENRARGGRSSRTFITDGSWENLRAELKRGDFVLIQFGENDTGGINEEPPGSTLPLRARGTLPGLGEERQAIDNVVTRQHEVVHTFGWYLRQMIADTRAAGATPILVTPTVGNRWRDGRIIHGPGDGRYAAWMRELAAQESIALIDLTRSAAAEYERRGESAVQALFTPEDRVHTTAEGAALNARLIADGLRELRDGPFGASLKQQAAVDRL